MTSDRPKNLAHGAVCKVADLAQPSGDLAHGAVWHGPFTPAGDIYANPSAASRYRAPITAEPEPPTVAEIGDVRSAVLSLCERAVRASRADIAAELRAAVGPLVDAESAARRERQP